MTYRSIVTTTVLATSFSALILLLPGCSSSPSTTWNGTGGSTLASGSGGNRSDGGVTSVAKTIAGINYAGTASPSQTLDLLLPGNATLPLPLIIRIHGGAFSGGSASMEETGTAASAILAKGYALAALNYRLSGEALFPAGAQDVKAAVRWLRAHAADYGLDTAHFVSWGESAGAWFAIMLGVTGDQATVFDDDSLGNPGVSTAVVGAVDWYGPVDFATQDSQQVAHPPASCATGWQQHTPAGSGDSTWLGGALNSAAVSTKVMQANLVAYVRTAKTLPLFIMAHGDDDCIVSWGQSQELNDALAQVDNSASFTILAGYSHGDSRFETTQTAPDLTLLATVLGR
jgi:acetyl esterase/lipase